MKLNDLLRNLRRFVFALVVGLMGPLLAACGGSGELDVGDPAPGFTLPAAQGGEIALSDYTGVKPALLYFHMAMG